MGIFATIVAVLKFIGGALDAWFEWKVEKKKKKMEALNVVKEGIAKRDPSAVTRGLDALNRV